MTWQDCYDRMITDPALGIQRTGGWYREQPGTIIYSMDCMWHKDNPVLGQYGAPFHFYNEMRLSDVFEPEQEGWELVQLSPITAARRKAALEQRDAYIARRLHNERTTRGSLI